MGKSKNDDWGTAIALIVVAVIIIYIYRGVIISWIESEITKFVIGLVSAIITIILFFVEFVIPLAFGWWIAKKLINDYYWKDWKVGVIGVAIGVIISHFVTGYFALSSFIGWGMLLNVILDSLNDYI